MNANVWGVILLMSTMTVWVPSDASTTTCEDALTTLLAEYTGDTECMTTLNAFFSESTSDACTNANKTAIGTCMNVSPSLQRRQTTSVTQKHEDAWDTFETDCDDVRAFASRAKRVGYGFPCRSSVFLYLYRRRRTPKRRPDPKKRPDLFHLGDRIRSSPRSNSIPALHHLLFRRQKKCQILTISKIPFRR